MKTSGAAKKARRGARNAPARSRATRKRTKKAGRGSSRKSPTKASIILKALTRDRGATVAELMKVTGWQAHSVRGFLSGTVRKRMGLELRSEATEKGRRYRVVQAEPQTKGQGKAQTEKSRS